MLRNEKLIIMKRRLSYLCSLMIPEEAIEDVFKYAYQQKLSTQRNTEG